MSKFERRYKPMNGLLRTIKEKGYNLHSFSEAIGIPYMNVYRWVNGIYEPYLRDIKRIADFLGCKVDDLLED